MNNNNNSNNFDYDEYLKRIKRLNDDVDQFSISTSKSPEKPVKAEEEIELIPTQVPKENTSTLISDKSKTIAKPISQSEKVVTQPKPQAKKVVAQKSTKAKKTQDKKVNKIDLIKRVLMIAVGVLFCVILLLFFSHLNSNSDVETDLTQSDILTEVETDAETTEVTTTEPEPVTYSYETLLVNYENPLPDDYTVTLVDYQDANGDWWTVAEEIVDPLDIIIAAAANQGVYLAINSAYRSNEAQNRLYVTSVEEYEAEGYSYDEAYDLTGDYVAEPGTSEHETGLSIDFGYTGSTTWTECYSWLEANSYLYGFIVRYPSGKSDITNITYETWHYRYVGVEIATEMYELDMCLEEYYEYKGW